MILRRATGTDKSVKERKGLKRKFAAYAGLTLDLFLQQDFLQAAERRILQRAVMLLIKL